jgi:hypothetical protein
MVSRDFVPIWRQCASNASIDKPLGLDSGPRAPAADVAKRAGMPQDALANVIY